MKKEREQYIKERFEPTKVEMIFGNEEFIMDPKQIALVITFDASKISKEKVLDKLEIVKLKLEKIIAEEFSDDTLVIDKTHDPVFIDDKYDDWE